MSIEQRLAGISPDQFLTNISIEELLRRISPEQRKKLFELVLKMLASGLADETEPTGKSSTH